MKKGKNANITIRTDFVPNNPVTMLSTATAGKDGDRKKIGVVDKYHLRPICLHIGLIITCIAYAIFGAFLFQSIEQPVELNRRVLAKRNFQDLKDVFFSNLSNGISVDEALERFTRKSFKLFEDPHFAHTYENFITKNGEQKDMWSLSASLIFTTTTVIPVGYGYIFPVSTYGKMLLIIYALLGIPLTLVTMADTGKFASQLISRWFNESITIPAILFVLLLFTYPLVIGYGLRMTSKINFLDAVYFTLTSIFTIGFGDMMPEMNVLHLVVFIVIGVILVTITIDFVAVELIDHIHYMGRHVGKAKELAGKMFQLAQSLNMKSGVANGIGQLHALARFGLLNTGKNENTEATEDDAIAFSPDVMEGFDFVDTLSIYSRRSRHSNGNSARNLFIS